jgi:hypothetical protein
MAEKKSKLGAVLAIGALAAAAGGVIAYLKRAEIDRLAEDILDRVKPTEEDGVYSADLDDDGTPDIILADTTGDGQIDTVLMDTTGDGKADTAAVDLNGNGEVDVIVDITNTPEDGEEGKE